MRGSVRLSPSLIPPSLPSALPILSPVPTFSGPGPVLWRSRPGPPRDPSFTGRLSLRPRPLEGLGVSSPPGRSATTCGAGSCSRVAGVIVPAPGALGGGGVCRLLAALGYSAGRAALILTVPGGGTGPGASRLRRTPSAIRGGQLGIGELVGPCLTGFGGGLCGPPLTAAEDQGCGLFDFSGRLIPCLSDLASPGRWRSGVPRGPSRLPHVRSIPCAH